VHDKEPKARYRRWGPATPQSSIGLLWGVDPMRIAMANRLADPNVLYVGQVLCIPLG
jgi:hypothetical protein